MIKIPYIFKTNSDKNNNPAKRGKMVTRWREFWGNKGDMGADFFFEFGVSEYRFFF